MNKPPGDFIVLIPFVSGSPKQAFLPAWGTPGMLDSDSHPPPLQPAEDGSCNHIHLGRLD